jgi:hypothetical protein
MALSVSSLGNTFGAGSGGCFIAARDLESNLRLNSREDSKTNRQGFVLSQVIRITSGIADLNEAVRRQTLRVRRMGDGCLMVEISWATRRNSCDPSAKNDAGGTPAS